MNRIRPGNGRIALYCLLGMMCVVPTVLGAERKGSKNPTQDTTSLENERKDRIVDQAALATQEEAIQKIRNLLQKNRGKSHQEVVFLEKLSEAQILASSIQFRITHGAKEHLRSGHLKKYQAFLRAAVSSSSEIIQKFPGYSETDRILFLRAKAFDELKEKKLAKNDYYRIIQDFSNSEIESNARMALAQYAIDDNDHAESIRLLKVFEERKSDSFYPFAIYKLAWSYFNLANLANAVDRLDDHIQYYRSLRLANEESDSATSDQALLENSLLDLALFFFEGTQKQPGQFNYSSAFSFFEKRQPGPVLGKILLRYAKLLRANALSSELAELKAVAVKQAPKFGETLDILVLTLEDHFNRRRLTEIEKTASEIVDFVLTNKPARTSESFVKAIAMLKSCSEDLQKLIFKNQTASLESLQELKRSTLALYAAITQVLEPDDPRTKAAHFNRAEIAYHLKDYDLAAQEYRWCVKNDREKKISTSLRAISARSERIAEKGLFPKKITFQAGELEESEAKIDPLIEEWIDWIDEHAKYVTKKEEVFDNFGFEANRLLFSLGQKNRALKRLKAFVKSNESSRFSIPSASLVLDALGVNLKWSELIEFCEILEDLDAIHAGPFYPQVYKTKAQASFKLIELEEKKQDHSSVRKLAKRFLSDFKQDPLESQVRLLAAKAALAQDDEEEALEGWSQVIQKDKGELWPLARLSRGSLYERHLQLVEAYGDWRSLMASEKVWKSFKVEEQNTILQKTALFGWATRSLAKDYAGYAANWVCGPGFTDSGCRFLELLVQLDRWANGQSLDYGALQLRYEKDPQEYRAIRALLLLSNEKLKFGERQELLEFAASGVERVDPMFLIGIHDLMAKTVLRTFRDLRSQLADAAPLVSADPYIIRRRVKKVQKLEELAMSWAKQVPLIYLKAALVNEVADLYAGLGHDLRKVPMPSGMKSEEKKEYAEALQKVLLPFEEKGIEIRNQAFEIASDQSIAEPYFSQIFGSFQAENPSYSKQFDTVKTFFGQKDSLLLFKEIFKEFWNDSKKDKKLSMWLRAIEAKDQRLVSFYLFSPLLDKKSKTEIEKTTLQVFSIYSYWSIGLASEAMEQLGKFIDGNPPALDPIAMNYLLARIRLASFSKKKTQERMVRLRQLDPELRRTARVEGAKSKLVVEQGFSWADGKVRLPAQVDSKATP